MRRTFPFALASAVVLVVAFAALAACSPAADRSLPAEGESGAGSTDGTASEGGRTFESTAMVVTFGDGEILFVAKAPTSPGSTAPRSSASTARRSRRATLPPATPCA